MLRPIRTAVMTFRATATPARQLSAFTTPRSALPRRLTILCESTAPNICTAARAQHGSRRGMASQSNTKELLDEMSFHRISDEVLDLLSDEFSDICDEHEDGADFDVTFGDGVLTFSVGDTGTYVINKQTPNKQVWLSSPSSGPKRYDYNPETEQWDYSHDNTTLHERLSDELSEVLGASHVFKVPEGW